jgi:hypothetical protein
VAVGPIGSGTPLLAKQLLGAHGVSESNSGAGGPEAHPISLFDGRVKAA